MRPAGSEAGCQRRGRVLGVTIVHDGQVAGRHLVHRQQIVHRVLEGPPRRGMREIADVLAHERLTVDHQRDAVLEIGAHGENRPPGTGNAATAAGASPRPRRSTT